MTSALIGIMSSVPIEEYGNRRLYVNGQALNSELNIVDITTTIGNIVIPTGLELLAQLSNPEIDAKINYDPDYANIVLLTHFDGQENSQVILDNSQYERAVISHGNVHITSEQRKFSQSAYFDGSGDYLTVPYAPELSFRDVDFTIEGWAYNSSNVNYTTLIDFRGNGSYNSSWAIFIHNSANTLNVYDGPTTSTKLSTPINTLSKNQWFHFSVTRDSGNVTIRINNIVADTKVYNPPATHSTGIKIATNYNNGDSFTGYLDDFRFTRNSMRIYPSGLPNYSYYDGNNITLIVDDASTTMSLGSSLAIPYPSDNTMTLIPPINGYGIVSSDNFAWYIINVISKSIVYAKVYTSTYGSLNPVVALYSNTGVLLSTANLNYYSTYVTVNNVDPGKYYIGIARGNSRFYNYFQTTTENQSLSGWDIQLDVTVTDKEWANVVLLAHFDGTNGSRSFIDSSSHTKYLFYNGNTSLSTADFKFGNASVYFDGNRDYIYTSFAGSAPHSSLSNGLRLLAQDFTIEFWIKTIDSDFVIIDYWLEPGYINKGYKLAVNSSGYLTWWNNNGIILTSTGNVVNDNQWNHIAITRENLTVRFFVNGILSGSEEDPSNYNNTASYVYIGAQYTTSTYDMSGYIDELRIINGRAYYTENFAVPTEPFQEAPDGWHIISGVTANTNLSSSLTFILDSIFDVSGIQTISSVGNTLIGVQAAVDEYYGNVTILMHFDGSNNEVTFKDSSSYDRTPTVYGNTKLSNVQTKYGITSGYFDGNGDYLVFPVNSDFNMSGGDFTVECWVYVNPGPVGYSNYRPYIFQFRDPTDSYSRRWEVYMSPQRRFILYSSAIYNYGADRITSSVKEYSQWYHIAIVKSGEIGTLYVNGVSEGNTVVTTTTTTPTIPTPPFTPVTVSLPLNNLVVTNQGNIRNKVAWYKFQITELSNLFVSTGGEETVNTKLGLFNSSGYLITSDDDSGPGVLSYISRTFLTPGTYYIATGDGNTYYSSYQWDAGNYYGADPAGNFTLSITTTSSALPISLPLNNLVVDDQANIKDKVAWYKFELTEQLSQVTITTNSFSSVNTYLVLYNSSGSYITYNDDYNSPTSYLSRIIADNLSAGTYYIVAGYSYISTSSYSTFYAYGYGNVPAGDFTLSVTSNSQSIWPSANLDITLGYYFDSYSTDYNLNGFIDEFRVTKGVARYSDRFVAPVGPFQNTDTPDITVSETGFELTLSLDNVLVGVMDRADDYYGNVVILMHFDGANASTTFTDNSQYARSSTRAGNTNLSTVQFKYGVSSAYFDGTGDYIDVASSADFQVLNSDFTVEAWVYYTLSNSNKCIWELYTSTSNRLNVSVVSGTIVMYSITSAGGATRISATAPAINQWHHVALCKSGTTFTLFINGVSSGTSTTTVYPTNSALSLRIGDSSFASNSWIGYIDEFRITKNIARYSSRFVPPVGPFQNTDAPDITFTPSGVVGTGVTGNLLIGAMGIVDEYYANVTLLLHFDGANNSTTFMDNSSSSRTISRAGDTRLSNVQVKYGSASAYFDGTGDNLTTPWDTGFTFGTGDFTVELWIYPTRALSGTGIIGGTYAGGSDSIPWALAAGSSAGASTGNTLYFGHYTGSAWTSINTSYALTGNTWTHLAVTRASGNLKIFADGVIIGTGNLTTNIGTDTFLRIGERWDTGGTPAIQGYLDEVRITKGVARYVDRFVAPVGMFQNTDNPNVTVTFDYDRSSDVNYDNVSLLLHFDGADNGTTFVDSSSFVRTVTTFGNTKTSTSVVKYGNTSGYFDGVGDYLQVAGANLNFASSDFTLEGWFYRTATNRVDTIIRGDNGSTAGVGLDINFSATNSLIFSLTGGSTILANVPASTHGIVANTWYHLAFVRSGNLWTEYVNGTAVGYGIVATAVTSPTNYRIGGNSFDSTYSWNGYIDDFRVTIGNARYTSNFIPSTTAYADRNTVTSLNSQTFVGNSLIIFNSSEDTQFANVTLLLHGEGSNNSTTLSDSSLYNNLLIPVGDTKISVLRSRFGSGSMTFDGTGDYILIPFNSRFRFGSGDFTIESFVYQNVAQSGAEGAIATLWGTENSWYFGINQSSQLVFYYNGSASATGGTFTEVAGTVATSQWVHVAVTRSGSILRLFINGTVVRTNSSFTATLFNSNNAIGIGAQSSGGTPIKSSFIDDLRITRGFARYTANFATPTTQFYDGVNIIVNTTGLLADDAIGNISVITDQILNVTGLETVTNIGNSNAFITPQESFDDYFDSVVLLSHFDGSNASTTFVDSSSYNRQTQVFGNVIINTNQSISGNSSVYFNGVGDYLSLLNAADFNFRTADFTLETWIYITAQPTTLWPVYSISTASASPLSVYLNASKFLTVDINGNVTTSNTFAVTTNTWTSIAISRKSNTVRGFVNGEIVFQTTSAFDFNSATEVRVGRGPRTSTDYAAGYIDELRVTKSFGRYTVPYTPTARYTEPVDTDPYYSNVSLLMHFDGANNSNTFIDNSINNRTFTRFGDAIISNVQSVFGNTSLYLDGTDDYLTTTWDSGFAFGTADFTIELWVYPTRTGNGTGILGGTYTSGSDPVNWTLATGTGVPTNPGGTGNTIFFGNYSGSAWTTITTSYVLTNNTWTHLAVARNSGNLRIFANGSLIGSGSYTQNIGTDSVLRIGNRWDNAGGNSAFQGYIDEIRITNGISRYFANFTPATSSFLEVSQFDLTTNAIVQLSSVAANIANVTISSDFIANLPVTAEYLSNGAITTDLVYNSPAIMENQANGAISSDVIFANPARIADWPESYSLVIVLLSFDGANNSTTFTDSSLYNRAITRVGDTKISTVLSKFGTSSAFFDGNGDYLTAAGDTRFFLTGGDFTVECWVYFNSVASVPHIFQIGTSVNVRWNVYLSGATFNLFSINGSGTGANRITSSTVTTGQWYHLAVVKIGTITTLYVNGNSQGTTTTTVWPPSSSLSLALGTQHFTPAAQDYLNGYIDDFRITRGLGRYSANFAPPTRSFFNPASSTVTVNGSEAILNIGDVIVSIE